MEGQIRIVLAEDHAIVRQTLRRLLDAEGGLEVVAEACDGSEALRRTRDLEPDVILMDIAMPRLDGVEATRRILRARPGARVLVLSVYGDHERVRGALVAGAAGYVTKEATAAELFEAVRAVARGETWVAPHVPPELLGRWRAERDDGGAGAVELTPREREVLQLLAEGRTVKEIGAELLIAPKTADAHKTNLMKKLGIHNRVELVKYAIAKRLIVL